jgi:hypothetical protein
MYQWSDMQCLLMVMETLDGLIEQLIQANTVPTPELEHVAAALQDKLYDLGNHLDAKGHRSPIVAMRLALPPNRRHG